jgi:phage gp16-like protein
LDNTRNAELAAIHVAKKQLRLDEATYRSIVEMVSARFGHPVSSAGLMGSRERRALLEQLRTWGFRKADGATAAPATRPGQSPQAQKILALWAALVEAGAVTVTDPGDPSCVKQLRSFVKRMTGVESASWLSAHQANNVIEGLKAWLERTFVKQAGANPE